MFQYRVFALPARNLRREVVRDNLIRKIANAADCCSVSESGTLAVRYDVNSNSCAMVGYRNDGRRGFRGTLVFRGRLFGVLRRLHRTPGKKS